MQRKLFIIAFCNILNIAIISLKLADGIFSYLAYTKIICNAMTINIINIELKSL